MKLIAIETATENCSVAVTDGLNVFQKQAIEPRKHAELVLPFLGELLQKANLTKRDIEGIVFGHGPGAFTGVRIAIGVVQGLAVALNVPVLGISTLENMAQGAWLAGKRGSVLVLNDARMNELYGAQFELTEKGIRRSSDDALYSPEKVVVSGFDHVIGNGLKAFPELMQQVSHQSDSEALPNAANLLSLSKDQFKLQAHPAHQISPNYVRNQVVRT